MLAQGTDKARAQQLRRLAYQRGYALRKSRLRNPDARDYGKWYVIDASHNVLVRECQDLDDVEVFLRG